MTGRIRHCFAGIALASISALPAAAQSMKGTVRELGTRGTLPGITVLLLDANDSTLRRIVTKTDGTYSFTVGPGTYSLSLRALGFEPMLTTPFPLAREDQLTLDFDMIRSAVGLDTVAITASYKLTPGRMQFLEHYRAGSGMFFSGLEISASKKGIAEFVSTLPGFADFAGGKAGDRSSTACQTLNDELKGVAASVSASRRSARAEFERRDDLCALRDERGRTVYATDAPCVTSQVDRMGLVKRIEGTDLVVHRHQKIFTPAEGLSLSEADPVNPLEMIVHLSEIIAVEFYQKPSDIPTNMRIRGSTPEAEHMVGLCAHIQFWTRAAW